MKFEIDRTAKTPRVWFDGRRMDVPNWTSASVQVELGVDELNGLRGEELPKNVALRTWVKDLGQELFDMVDVVWIDNELVINFLAVWGNDEILGDWSARTLLSTASEVAAELGEFEVVNDESSNFSREVTLRTKLSPDLEIVAGIHAALPYLGRIVTLAEMRLRGKRWDPKYETDEPLFTTEVLIPLLRKMGFHNVRYNHGTREYGKDITFCENTAFGTVRRYGLQAKAGNIRGNVNSDIDEIIGQLRDAFAMPYYELGSDQEQYISTLLIVCSGAFTGNAQDKIAKQVPRGVIGSIIFLDKQSVCDLMERHWG